MKNAKLYLDKLLNKQVLSIAYPFGKYNNNTLKAAAEAGYSLAFTTKGGFARRGNGMLTLKRVRVNASDSIKTFADKITTQR